MNCLRRRGTPGRQTPFAVALIACASFAGRSVEAQSYSVLQEFEAETSYQAGLILGIDGRLYGTSFWGGPLGSGTVFAMDVSGANYTVLHAFSSSDDGHPASRLLQTSDGSLYGTGSGAIGGPGAIFRIDPQGDYSVLHAFSYGSSGGVNPYGGLTLASDGFLYGTTLSDDDGTIFRIGTDGTGFTVIHDGGGTSGLIQASDGRLYGAKQGAVYRLDADGSDYEIIHTFSTNDWMYDLIEVAGVLYGVSGLGGTHDVGFLYRLDLDGGNFQVLHDFEDVDGQKPRASLFHASDGLLYGTTSTSGLQGYGTIFKIETSGANFSGIFNFEGRDGGNPAAALMETGGFLYGTTEGAGAGLVFKVTLGGGIYSILHSIEHGSSPFDGVVQDASGLLYGSAALGGNLGRGTVFKIDPSGATPTEAVHTFIGSDGMFPRSLLLLPDGYLYGWATGGGPGDAGTLFKVEKSGNDFSLMHSFDGDDGNGPSGRPVLGTDGALYGTTYTGQNAQIGSVFKIDTDGSDFTSLLLFTPAEGDNPSGLIQASDGLLYGATRMGPNPPPFGSAIFKIETSGQNFSVVDVLDPLDGHSIEGSLLEGTDGFLYGTTYYGGSGTQCADSNGIGCGALFKVQKSGADFSVLHGFTGDDGVRPSSGLLQASDGLLYGVTGTTGCDAAGGTLYRIEPDGSGFLVLHRFMGPDGSGPSGELFEGADGALYGTTRHGGSLAGGVVFRLDLATACVAAELSPSSGAAAGAAFTLLGAGFQDALALTLGGEDAVGVSVENPTTLTATSPELAPGTLNDLLLKNPDGTLATFPDAWLADFLDVPQSDLFHDSVERLFRAGVTAGCGSGSYCRSNPVTRAQMAVFLLKSSDGPCFQPPYCFANVFEDVSCEFPQSFAANWIVELYNRGITGGCSASPLLYCPDDPVTRAQMAVFILKAEHGSGYTPPNCAGVFEDVPCPGQFTSWIEQLSAEGITAGCQLDPPLYCPSSSVTRAQMAAFLDRAFLLP